MDLNGFYTSRKWEEKMVRLFGVVHGGEEVDLFLRKREIVMEPTAGLRSQLKRFPALHAVLYKYGTLILFGLLIGTTFTKINLLPIGPAIQFLGEGFLSLVGYK